MIIGKVLVSKTRARAKELSPLTVGMVGAQIELECGKEWEGLTKTAVFHAGDRAADVLVTGNTACVPCELLLGTGAYVWMGVYGINESGEVAIPTVWVNLGLIRQGAEPSGAEAAEAVAELWQQALGAMGALDALKTQDKSSLVAAVNEIFETGGGESAYDIALENGFEGTEAQWLASLKGEKGEAGAAGAAGAAGQNGLSIYVSTNASDAAAGSLSLSDITVPNGHQVCAGDLVVCSGYLYTVTDVEGNTAFLAFLDKLASGSGGGMDATASALLITILRSGVYSTNQSSNITALAAALEITEEETPVDPEEPDTPETVTYSVTNQLTNVTNGNALTSVTEGESYSATLSANSGYVLGSVTVTMGGSDITASSYADGVITVASVTGDIVITAQATAENSGESGAVELTKAGCVFRWDFSTEYSDGGTTEYTDTKGAGAAPMWYSEVFEQDTVVNVTILYGTANTNLRQYCACIPADTEIPASENFSSPVYYMQQIGSAQVTAYTAQYTVRSGYRLAVINYNAGSPSSVTAEK